MTPRNLVLLIPVLWTVGCSGETPSIDDTSDTADIVPTDTDPLPDTETSDDVDVDDPDIAVEVIEDTDTSIPPDDIPTPHDTDTDDVPDSVVTPSFVEAEIGPEGGELTLDGARLVIPAGALDSPRLLRLVRTDEPAPAGYHGYSTRWRFEPSGLEFAASVRVELPFEGDATRATIFWSHRHGTGYVWRPTAQNNNIAVASVEHFSDGFVADGTDYVDIIDATCVRTRVLQGRKIDPSGIGLFFGVEDCEGRPVRALPQPAFRVIEGGVGLGAEAQATLLPKPGALALVTLVLDLSVSSDEYRADLIAAAKRFVTSLHQRLPGQVIVGIEYFAAMTTSVRVLPHTVLLEDTLAKLTELETVEVPQPNGINLHGAIMDALDRINTAREARYNRSANGALVTAHLVVFTDSDDTTKKFTAGEVGTAIATSPTHVLGVGFMGPDYVGEKLAALAPDGVFEAVDTERLGLSFAGALNRLVGQFESTYFLAYCTPTVAGEHAVHIDVNGAELSSYRGWTFTGAASGLSCTANRFSDACLDRECGGVACGACDDREERCDGNSGQCRWLCDLDGRCGDRPHTNTNGYAYSCPDTDVWAACGTSACRPLKLDAANCGECGARCAVGGSCSNGACICPTGRADCDGTCRTLATDANHCGECGNKCPTGATCGGGVCTCATGTTACGDACRNLLTDRTNCGECGNVCPTGATCQSGACRCPTNQTACDGACVAMATNRNHCGTCGNACLLGCDGSECLTVSDIELGDTHTCARTSRGVYCWGNNANSRLGISPAGGTRTNPAKGPAVAFTQLALGYAHACGLQAAGTVSCWGSNGSLQLGRTSATTTSAAPLEIANLTGVTKIVAGGAANCAQRNDGVVFCWGANTYGQIAFPTLSNRSSAVEITALQGAKQVALGSEFGCAIMSDDTVACFGRNNHGQLGSDPSVVSLSATPLPVPGLTAITHIAAGQNFACATDGQGVWCWGQNTRGQLGDGTIYTRVGPSRVVGVTGAAELHLGSSHGCARLDGDLTCWGAEVPFLSTSTVRAPARIEGLGAFVEIESGTNSMCLRRPSGELACWGQNGSGQLGIGTTSTTYLPTTVVWQ